MFLSNNETNWKGKNIKENEVIHVKHDFNKKIKNKIKVEVVYLKDNFRKIYFVHNLRFANNTSFF